MHSIALTCTELSFPERQILALGDIFPTRMVVPGIPCRLFVSSRLLFDPLATTASVFTQTNSKAKRRGECGQDPCPHSRGNPRTGTGGVLIGSLRASVLTPWVCRVVHRWQPGVAASWRFEAVGEGKRHPRAHALQPASPGGEAESCPCVANHSSPPCWSLRAAVTVGEAFKKPRYLPPLPHAAAGFREKTLWSTAPLHNPF